MPNSYGFIKTLEDKQKNFLYNSNYMKLSWNMGYFLLKIHAQRLPTTSTLATYNIYLWQKGSPEEFVRAQKYLEKKFLSRRRFGQKAPSC